MCDSFNSCSLSFINSLYSENSFQSCSCSKGGEVFNYILTTSLVYEVNQTLESDPMFICVCNHERYGSYSPVKSQCIYIAINRQECQYNNYNIAIISIAHYATALQSVHKFESACVCTVYKLVCLRMRRASLTLHFFSPLMTVLPSQSIRWSSSMVCCTMADSPYWQLLLYSDSLVLRVLPVSTTYEWSQS